MQMGKIGLGIALLFVSFILWNGFSDMGTAFKGVADNISGGAPASNLGGAWISGQPIFLPLTFLLIAIVVLISGVMDRGRGRR